MGRKKVIEQNIHKHSRELEESIKILEPKLIEAFVNVYGEKHRDKIASTIINMNYTFFIPEHYCNILLKSPHLRKKIKYIIKSYLKYLKDKNSKFRCVAEKDQVKYIIRNYLSRYPFKEDDYVIFKSALESDCACCSAIFYESKEFNYAEYFICLPIFTIDLKTIIHELNHALNMNIIGFTNEYLKIECLFKTEASEELVNDYIAELVLNAYLKIGGPIPKALKRVKLGNEYEYKDYIVTYLFDSLIDLILESRISDNYNLFYNLVGINKAKSLEHIMADLYKKDYFDEYLYKELIYLIDEIYVNVINADIPNIHEMVQELEEQGLVRSLKKKED